MERKDLNKERMDLGMPNVDKKFNTNKPASIIDALKKKPLDKEAEMFLYEETLIKLGFTQELMDDESDYYFTFEISDKDTSDTLTLISCAKSETDNGKYDVRLFDTSYFICKTIKEIRCVTNLATKNR